MDTPPPVVSSRRQACASSTLTVASKRAWLTSISSSAAKRSAQSWRGAEPLVPLRRDRPRGHPRPLTSMFASSPAGMPSSARAPSGVSPSWMPDCLPSCGDQGRGGVQAPTSVAYCARRLPWIRVHRHQPAARRE